EALEAGRGGRQDALHPSIARTQLELGPAVALADPEKPSSIRQPAWHLLIEIHPRRIALAQEHRRLAAARISLEKNPFGLIARLHAHDQPALLGPVHRS